MRVERATNSSFSSNRVSTTLAAGTRTYSDTTVIGGANYYYRVFAYNSVGDSNASNSVSVTPPINAASLYSTYCAACHGANRQGGSSGVAVTSTALSGRSTYRVTNIISSGTGSMPGYSSSMNSTQISALASYLKNTP